MLILPHAENLRPICRTVFIKILKLKKLLMMYKKLLDVIIVGSCWARITVRKCRLKALRLYIKEPKYFQIFELKLTLFLFFCLGGGWFWGGGRPPSATGRPPKVQLPGSAAPHT